MERKRKKTEDVNQIAASIVEAVTSDRSRPEQPAKEKNPAAVALGRLGGLKGGKARAEKLSAESRKHIAIKAAHTRWAKIPKS